MVDGNADTALIRNLVVLIWYLSGTYPVIHSMMLSDLDSYTTNNTFAFAN